MNAPTQQPAPDFGEPWQNELGDFEIYPRTSGDAVAYAEGSKTRDRIIAVVNACAGMVDPAAEIQALRLAAPVWQTIETAPKSSRSVMIHCSEYRNTYVAENGTGKWRHFGCGRDVMEKPTHWMPLPTPPQV